MQYLIESILYNYDKGIILKNKREIKLTKLQKKLLNYFIDHPQTIIPKTILMENVWGRIVTENSVDQFISILRNHLEKNPSKPSIIVTYFGEGISFEGDVIEQSIKNDRNQSKIKLLLLPLLLIALVVIYQFNKQSLSSVKNLAELNNDQKILILPMSFEGNAVGSVAQQGMKDLLKSTFVNLDSEGQMIFDETSDSKDQTIERHWRVENDLMVISSQVAKVGNVYNAVIELSSGVKTIKTQTISAKNLNDLLNNQIEIIVNYQQEFSKNTKISEIQKSPSQTYIQALGHKKNGDINKAKELVLEVLNQQENYFQARFTLAEILFKQKKYDESLAQLTTLKSTSAYQTIGTEIELKLAEINYKKAQYLPVIDDLKAYQLSHESISEVKKAKIKITMANAYNAMGDAKTALTFYKNAIANIKQQLNPLLYAQSYFGQAMLLLMNSNSNDVYDLFEKSANNAKQASNVFQQVLALNEMAKILHARQEWEKAIAIQTRSIELLELESDQRATASGLGTLIGIQQQRGHFTDANEMNEKLGKIADELNSHLIKLHYLHYKSVVKMHNYEYEQARKVIDQHLELAVDTKNYAMQLDNAFLEFEWRLSKKEVEGFKPEWDKRTALIKDIGFERFQIYMDLFLARYYQQINADKQAIALFIQLTEDAKATKDYRFVAEAQNFLAQIYLKTDAQKALTVLNEIEEFNPTPNPYLHLKAQALFKLGNNIDALSLMNQAKLVYHESWTAENQALLDEIKGLVD